MKGTDTIVQGYDIKLTPATRYGYGAASIADTIILDFVSAFFLFFLTDIVGINPAMAGSVAFISIFWDAITGPVIGGIADRTEAKGGKYRRVLMISILPVFICTILMFLKVHFGSAGIFIYYLAVSMMYYTSYSLFNIPYMALGSSLTSNETEKTKLSGVRQSFGFAGALFSGAIPAVLIDGFQAAGLQPDWSYTVTALILGLCSASTIFITWVSTRGKELDFHENTEEKNSPGTLKDIFKCKSYIILLIFSLVFYIGYSMLCGGIMYVIKGLLGLSEGASSGIFITLAASGIMICAFLTKMAEKFDKKAVCIATIVFSAVGMLFTRVWGINSLLGFGIYIVMINVSFSGFLMFIFNFLYDVVDIIDFKTNKRTSGTVCAYYSLVIKLGKAGAMQLIGILLVRGGYDAALTVQTGSSARAILNVMTLWPAAAFLVSLILLGIYPVSRRRIAALQKAKMLKQAGEAYESDVFKKLL